MLLGFGTGDGRARTLLDGSRGGGGRLSFRAGRRRPGHGAGRVPRRSPARPARSRSTALSPRGIRPSRGRSRTTSPRTAAPRQRSGMSPVTSSQSPQQNRAAVERRTRPATAEASSQSRCLVAESSPSARSWNSRSARTVAARSRRVVAVAVSAPGTRFQSQAGHQAVKRGSAVRGLPQSGQCEPWTGAGAVRGMSAATGVGTAGTMPANGDIVRASGGSVPSWNVFYPPRVARARIGPTVDPRTPGAAPCAQPSCTRPDRTPSTCART